MPLGVRLEISGWPVLWNLKGFRKMKEENIRNNGNNITIPWLLTLPFGVGFWFEWVNSLSLYSSTGRLGVWGWEWDQRHRKIISDKSKNKRCTFTDSRMDWHTLLCHTITWNLCYLGVFAYAKKSEGEVNRIACKWWFTTRNGYITPEKESYTARAIIIWSLADFVGLPTYKEWNCVSFWS